MAYQRSIAAGRVLRGCRGGLGLALLLAVGVLAAPTQALAAGPAATTLGASDVTYSAATLHGLINPHGQPANYQFDYGTTAKYGSQTPLAAGGTGTKSTQVSETISGLQPLTTYHYRVVAFGPTGVTKGSDRSFQTPKIPLSIAAVGVPNPVTYGNAFTVEGTLSGTGSANQPVVMQTNPFPYLTGLRTASNAELTSSVGGFSFGFGGLLTNTQIRVATVSGHSVASPILIENVAVRVTLHTRSTGRPGFARMYGTVTPAEVGSLVGFQLLKPGHRSVNVGGTSVKPGSPTMSRFNRVIRVHRGLYKALVQVSDGANVSGYSAPVAIR